MCRQCPKPATVNGLCEKHFQQAKYTPLGEPRTVKPKNRNYKRDELWERISRAWLADHPLCAACEQQGRMTPAQIVDHILPRRYYPELKYDKDNLQSLCQRRPFSCHQRKTALERRGIAVDFANRKKISIMHKMRP